jgi:hypothetical protein
VARLGERFGWRCYWCGDWCGESLDGARAQATVDHVRPLSRGGQNVVANCVLACLDCNHRKGDLLPEEWITSARFHRLGRRRCTNIVARVEARGAEREAEAARRCQYCHRTVDPRGYVEVEGGVAHRRCHAAAQLAAELRDPMAGRPRFCLADLIGPNSRRVLDDALEAQGA